jgi:hypothetical protein
MAAMAGHFRRAGSEARRGNDTGSTIEWWGVVLHGSGGRPQKNGGARPDAWSGVMPSGRKGAWDQRGPGAGRAVVPWP